METRGVGSAEMEPHRRKTGWLGNSQTLEHPGHILHTSTPPHLLLLDRRAHVAHLARHLEAGEDARGRGGGADGAVLTVRLGAVRHHAALVVVALDGACGEGGTRRSAWHAAR